MNKKIIVIVLSLVIILGLGSTLAYLRSDAGSNNANKITLADFHVDLITDITSLTIDKTYPMSDAEGLSKTGNIVTFAIKNNGDIAASYKVSLQDTHITKSSVPASTLKNTDVRYQLKRKVGDNNQETLDITNLDSTGLIDTGNIGSGITITYELLMWQDYNSTANGASFAKNILVEGMQISNLDKSGANFPELTDNMIPVYYEATSDTEGVWKKADSKNLNETYKWFDYDNQMWANAVTVKESGTNTRDYYLTAATGTVIPMDDITTMWVWIPRYKYVIFNGNNETAEEQEIKVIFEHGKETTGTVKCHDDILMSDNSNHSEICTDTTNGSIVNHKSTYTHPAFTFGDEELTGFWIGKFEMSTDDSTCNETPSAENCNKQGLNILVKPDQYSLGAINTSSIFANIRRMETYGNIHGFSQSSSATTWLNENSNLTGEINNDSNNLDTHMIKNMEWGAVAYLSGSKYGKYGNNLYTGNNKEVYINNNSDYKSGYSGGSYNSSQSNTSTYLYNNLTNQTNGQGYLGAGASTTGNIYGVYDMNGGKNEMTMANMVYSNGNFYSASSGVWSNVSGSNLIYPQTKYYDKYSYYSVFEKTDNSVANGKLGDATKETKKENITGWYSDNRNFLGGQYSFIYRGANANSGISGGIFYSYAFSGQSSADDSSRPVLTISREMPWKNE